MLLQWSPREERAVAEALYLLQQHAANAGAAYGVYSAVLNCKGQA